MLLKANHQGVTKCRERAKRTLWWPGLSRQIEDLVKQCRKCTERRINKKEPMIPSVVPDRPWQVISTDTCYVKKRPYLIVDCFWKFIEVNNLASLTSSETIRALKSVLARHVYRRWCARTTAPNTTQPSLPNLPKTGNSNMCKAVHSMPNPMEKRNELFRQRRTCCRRRVTLEKLFLHIDPRPCKLERARLSYYLAARFDAPFLAFLRLSNRAGLE